MSCKQVGDVSPYREERLAERFANERCVCRNDVLQIDFVVRCYISIDLIEYHEINSERG